LGSETLVHVGIDGLDRPLVARLDPSAGMGFGMGDALPLSVRATRVLAFDREGQRVGVRVVPAVPRFAELVRA
jgi:hypothetical protein